LKFGVIDAIVPEPIGGAHRDPEAAIAATGRAIGAALDSLGAMSRNELRESRATKFLGMGRKI
jgi:acetyl-CoA carboxylase carboxyl transferase subunit alpha